MNAIGADVISWPVSVTRTHHGWWDARPRLGEANQAVRRQPSPDEQVEGDMERNTRLDPPPRNRPSLTAMAAFDAVGLQTRVTHG